jgi:hypothetical protein
MKILILMKKIVNASNEFDVNESTGINGRCCFDVVITNSFILSSVLIKLASLRLICCMGAGKLSRIS